MLEYVSLSQLALTSDVSLSVKTVLPVAIFSGLRPLYEPHIALIVN